MVSCDCEDDCQDKSKCACWQLSIHQTDAAPGMKGKTMSNIAQGTNW
jgi:histone-lysine N-methyltransferase SETDB1